MDVTLDTISAMPERAIARYGAPPDEMPLGGYAILLGAYATLATTALALVRRSLPSRIGLVDVALLGVATHKMTRIATKDFVTSPLRAPFVRYERTEGAGEVREDSRGRGLRRAIGDLVTCPWCFAPWVATALYVGLAVRPRITRTVAAMFASVAISDTLQHLYGAVAKATHDK